MIAQMIAALMIVILGSCPSNSDAQPVAPMLPAGSGDSTNFLRWVNNLNFPPSVEWRSPRLWLSPTFGMAPYFGPRPLAKVDDWKNGFEPKYTEPYTMPDREPKEESSDRQSSMEDTNQGPDKRDSYLSMCHFKICNLGRKRRLSYFAAPAWPARYPSPVPTK